MLSMDAGSLMGIASWPLADPDKDSSRTYNSLYMGSCALPTSSLSRCICRHLVTRVGVG